MAEIEEQKICEFCVMDSTDPLIKFDVDRSCNHCKHARERFNKFPVTKSEKNKLLLSTVNRIKAKGKGRRYDCLIGLSGGLDSTYLALKVVEMGLRPLAVHVDNGWNTELSVWNIENVIKTLNIDFVTNVLDWNTFKDLQLSFLKSSLCNCEAPTDHSITATLFQQARRHNIKVILSGGNLATESIMPKSWGHYNQDLKLLLDLHKSFGTGILKKFPTISFKQYLYFVLIEGIRQVPILNFMEYDKEQALDELVRQVSFRPYRYKHGESTWTRFFQNYYLPKKFGIDKRKAHLSSLICSNQISRSDALIALKKPLYSPELLKQDYKYILKKLSLSEKQFQEIMNTKAGVVTDYKSHYWLLENFEVLKNIFRSIATRV